MRLQIRKSVFETNSSSTHALCIREEDTIDFAKIKNEYQKTITVQGDEFGWGFEVYHDVQKKLDYMFTMITKCCDNEKDALALMNKMKALLKSIGVNIRYRFDNVKREQSAYSDYCFTVFYDKDGCRFDGYIDHPDSNILDLLDDKKMFFKFLFGKESFLVTGNDNDSDFDNFIEKRGLINACRYFESEKVEGWYILYKGN